MAALPREESAQGAQACRGKGGCAGAREGGGGAVQANAGPRLCLHCEYFLESPKCCFLVSLTCDCVLVPCVRVPAPPVGEYVYPRKPREVTLTKSRVTSLGQNGHFPH